MNEPIVNTKELKARVDNLGSLGLLLPPEIVGVSDPLGPQELHMLC